MNYKQDVAGLGGQSEFIRETFDARWYHPITEDFIGLIHLQAVRSIPSARDKLS